MQRPRAALPIAVVLAAASACRSAPERAPEQLVMQVVRLEHAQAEEVVATLKTMLREAGSDVVVAPHVDANAVLLSGRAEPVRQALERIAGLDVERPR